MKPFRSLVWTWIGMVLLLAIEVAVAKGLGWYNTAPFFGIAKAALIAFGFMRVIEGPALIRVAALAGVFWLVVILGLGSMDTLTRVDHPVAMRTPVSP